MRFSWLFMLGMLLISTSSFAYTPFVVTDIRLEGLRRISAGTVFNYMPLKVGEMVDSNSSSRIVRDLYKTGFFKDIRLERDGTVLVIALAERPSIAEIEISGNKDIETEPLLESLKQIGLAEGRVFNRSLLNKIEQELERQYFGRGKYGVEIKTTTSPLPRNRMAVHIDVSEGTAARIKQINIVGNKVFDNDELLDEFELGPTHFWSFISGNDKYSKQQLSADLESLRSFYHDQGYIKFQISSTQVSLSKNKKEIFITVNIFEGNQYRINSVKLAGELVVPKEELFPLVTLKRYSIFSRKDIGEVTESINKRLGDEGYAFANVNAVPEINEDERSVDLTLLIDPGKLVYVRQINMSGNFKTRDEVLRREMRQMERTWYSTANITRSRERLNKLGYFEDLNLETPPVPGSADQVDMNILVKEKPSGQILAGVGYSQGSGILFNASISQDNFLGSGKKVTLAYNTSDVNTIYRFSFTNPYYTVDGVSRGYNLSYKETDASASVISDYIMDTFGGSINFGVPISEYQRVYTALGFDRISITKAETSADEITEFLSDNGSDYDMFYGQASLSYDSRNRAFFPDQGVYTSLWGEASFPGSSLQYYKVSLEGQYIHPLGGNYSILFNGELGYGKGYSEPKELPFFKHFYAGGIRSVRGFEDNSLGQTDSRGDPYGGNLRLVGNIEYSVPLPSKSLSRTMRLGLFTDVGNVFVTHDREVGGNTVKGGVHLDDLRMSYGLGLRWLSPIGALSFSIARPIVSQQGDKTQFLQFTLGANL